MEHISKESLDGTQLNLDALFKIAPSCFTEAREPDGTVRKVVDFTKLRLLLGDNAVEDAPEVYDFTWVGKRAAMREAVAPIRKTLRPCPEESVDWDTTKNIYIEGDNLEVLKLLQNSYMGKVKMIYIDPPYNTGNDFVYHDDFAQSYEEYDEANRDEEGNRYRRNTDSNGRFHSDWCSMMYARLMVARSLLSDDGVIYISIDDNEINNTIKICDEVFGAANKISQLITINNPRGRQSDTFYATVHEYLLCYSRNKEKAKIFGMALSEEQKKDYCFVDDKGRYRLLGLRQRGVASLREDRPDMFFPIYVNPISKEVSCEEHEGWNEVIPKKSDGREGRWMWGKAKCVNEIDRLVPKLITTRNEYDIFVKDYLDKGDKERTRKFKSVLDDKSFNNQYGTQEVKALLKGDYMSFPKSMEYIKSICLMAAPTDCIVLDFFSGSSTTAHALMKLNAEDGGHRKFIMVQWPEETPSDSEAAKAGYMNICEIGKERIRRAGKKIKSDSPLTTQGLDTGFRVFKCDETNYKDVAFTPKDYSQESLDLFVDNIKDDRSDLDLLFDCMLRWGVELSMPLKTSKVDGCTIHNVDDGNLVACFDGTVTEKVIDTIASLNPLRVVFRDSSFQEAATKMNLFEMFKQKCNWSEQEVRNNVKVI
jgi:adenine-specific DNA-methyltransferase